MKKLNNKGFLMAEAIVVGVFIMTLFTFIYTNMVPLISKYESATSYDDVSAVFDANQIRNMIFLDIERNPTNGTADKIFGGLATKTYILYDGASICDQLASANYCQTLFNNKHLNVDAIIVTSYKTTAIKTLKSDFNRAVGDYIEYIPEYTSSVGSSFDSYKRLIISFKDGRMANIEIKL